MVRRCETRVGERPVQRVRQPRAEAMHSGFAGYHRPNEPAGSSSRWIDQTAGQQTRPSNGQAGVMSWKRVGHVGDGESRLARTRATRGGERRGKRAAPERRALDCGTARGLAQSAKRAASKGSPRGAKVPKRVFLTTEWPGWERHAGWSRPPRARLYAAKRQTRNHVDRRARSRCGARATAGLCIRS